MTRWVGFYIVAPCDAAEMASSAGVVLRGLIAALDYLATLVVHEVSG